MANLDTYVVYSLPQLNSEDDNVSQSGIIGIFNIDEDLHGTKRVLTFTLKFLELIESATMYNDLDIDNKEDFEHDIRCEVDFHDVYVKTFGIDKTDNYSIQKLFKYHE